MQLKHDAPDVATITGGRYISDRKTISFTGRFDKSGDRFPIRLPGCRIAGPLLDENRTADQCPPVNDAVTVTAPPGVFGLNAVCIVEMPNVVAAPRVYVFVPSLIAESLSVFGL